MPFAEGFRAGAAARLARTQQRVEIEQEFVQQNSDIADALIKSAADVQAAALEQGKSVDVSPFRERLFGLMESAFGVRKKQFGTDDAVNAQFVNNKMAQFEAALEAAAQQPTAEEAARIGARAGVAGAVATAEGLTESGTPTTTAATAEAAGLVPPPATAPEPTASDIVTFRMPDGNVQSANVNDTDTVKRIIDQGGVRISLSVQSPTLEGVGALTGVTTKERESLKTKIQDTNAQIEELTETLKQFQETPEAGGLLGPVIEKAGGLVQQLPGGEGALESLGLNPAEVKAVRGNARAVASRMLSTITGEESGRFTDKERQIAEEVLGALDVTASSEQISAALNQAIDLMRRSEGRELVRFLQAFEGDINTPEGQEAFVEVLIANGFTRDRAIDAFLELEERLNISP